MSSVKPLASSSREIRFTTKQKLHQEGLLPQQHHDRMKHLVPIRAVNGTSTFAMLESPSSTGTRRIGSTTITAWSTTTAPTTNTRSFNRELAIPGKTLNILSPRRLHPMIPLRVQSVLSHLGLDNESLHIALAMAASVEMAAVGEHLCTHETAQETSLLSFPEVLG